MPETRDAFEVLGLEARFDLSSAEVQGAYLARLGGAHPDRAGGTEDVAAMLNAAKRVLEDPEARANLLLARLGGPTKESDRSLPEGFLEEMMEVRERMAAASAAGDTGQLEVLGKWAEKERDGHIRRVKELFEGAQKPRLESGVVQLVAIRRELNAWRYIERMLEQIAENE